MRFGRQARAAIVVALLAVLTAACAPSGSPAAQLRAWESGASYGSNQSQLGTDLNEIATGLRTGPLGAVHTACDGLGYDAGTAYGELPTTNQTLTDELNDEYLDLSKAGQACSTASSLSSKSFSRYYALVAKAERELALAKDKIKQILSS